MPHPDEKREHPIPDLLHPTPVARVDLAALERALDFAFASGGAESALGTCLDRASIAPSTWEPATFERDVFLDDLVRHAFPITIDGLTLSPNQRHLAALVSRPPADPSTVRLRQDVLAELVARPELRAALEDLYLKLRDLGGLLGPVDVGEDYAMNRRRVDTLLVVRDVVHSMAERFSDAGSALSRLASFGASVRDSEAFQRLSSLLDFEGSMASLDVRLRLGRDGTLRSFDIVKVDENVANPFYDSPWRRLVARVVRFFRGYRYKDDEVLEELIDGVFAPLRREVVKLFQLVGDVEFYLAGLGFAELAASRGLAVSLPTIAPAPATGERVARRVRGLFNPLLLLEPRAPVPCTLAFDRHDAIAILSGPNSGGKTRLLQTLAMTQMLGQAGLFVPAESAELVFAHGLFVSLIQDARADQREGRLGMELLRIRELFERLRPGGLVVLDELCSGTNPSEGEEIFELVVSLLAELEPQAFITTHFLDFAARLAAGKSKTGGLTRAASKLTFLQVELDHDEEPTYQFVPGVAKTSLARKIAVRLGVTRENLERLIERSRQRYGSAAETGADRVSGEIEGAAPISGDRPSAPPSAPGDERGERAVGAR